MKYQHVARAVYSLPWAILPEKLEAIIEVVGARVMGDGFTDEQMVARLEEAARTAGERRGAAFYAVDGESLVRLDAAAGRSPGARGLVAVLPVYGTIMPRATLMSAMSGGATVDGIRAAFREAMADESIGSVVLEFDSPGGQVGGIEELAAEIRANRGRKPIVASANTMMASAAYWLASQADEVVATPSSIVGSIGVIGAHLDHSRQLDAEGITPTIIRVPDTKAPGFGGLEPLGDEGLAEWQQQAQDYYALFVNAVAKGRGVGVGVVRDGYGKGGVLTAKRALDAGMVDRVESFDDTLRRAASGRIEPRAFHAESVAATFDVPTGHLPDEPVGMTEQQAAAQPDPTFEMERGRALIELRSR